jgi:hypothetical protein
MLHTISLIEIYIVILYINYVFIYYIIYFTNAMKYI